MTADEFTQRSKAVWSTGDYAPTSRQLQPVSEALTQTLQIAPGHRVLDIAAGHGNCAIEAARRGADVCASDFSPTMIDIGRARATEAGFEIAWQEADATDLPYEAGAFDRVTSVFGAIFAPDRAAVASEAVRVLKPGGLIGMTAWTSNGYTADLIMVSRSFGPPPPPGAPDPGRWGDPDEVRGLFEALGCTVETRTRSMTFRYASWRECRAALEAHGMTVVAKQSMPEERYEEMFEQIRDVAEAHDQGGGDGLHLASEYLEIVVAKP